MGNALSDSHDHEELLPLTSWAHVLLTHGIIVKIDRLVFPVFSLGTTLRGHGHQNPSRPQSPR